MNITIRRIDGRNAHFYMVDGDPAVQGKLLPSVTTILSVVNKPGLVPWAKNLALEKARSTLYEHAMEPPSATEWRSWVDHIIEEARLRPDEVKAEAADYGTRCHALIEAYLKGQTPEVPSDLALSFNAFYEWAKAADLTFEVSEQSVYHPVDLYAGTVDIQARRTSSGETVLVDIKTSKGLWPEYALQLAAYAKAWEAMGHGAVTEAWALRLPKEQPVPGDPPFEALRVADLEEGYRAFRGCLALWYYLRGTVWSPGLDTLEAKEAVKE